jgi:hypothetical protein
MSATKESGRTKRPALGSALEAGTWKTDKEGTYKIGTQVSTFVYNILKSILA